MIWSVNLSLVLWTFLSYRTVEAQYEDVRCKCICPSFVPVNSTRRVFVKSFHDPTSCKCQNVVDKAIQETQLHFCDKCDCQWQRRNTRTIQVVVIFIICVISLLVLYMLFLLCLDPLMTHRGRRSPENIPEAVRHEPMTPDPRADQMTEEALMSLRTGVMLRVKHEVQRMRGEQERWKGAVQEQRKHIYDRHTMLNWINDR